MTDLLENRAKRRRSRLLLAAAVTGIVGVALALAFTSLFP